jgi:hypothetical protein
VGTMGGRGDELAGGVAEVMTLTRGGVEAYEGGVGYRQVMSAIMGGRAIAYLQGRYVYVPTLTASNMPLDSVNACAVIGTTRGSNLSLST